MSNLEVHEAEQAAITAMCEAGTCDHPDCKAKKANWRAIAWAHGWRIVREDPRGYSLGRPCLYHAEQERAWPLGDWEGAARDIGLTEDDHDDATAGLHGFVVEVMQDVTHKFSIRVMAPDAEEAEGRAIDALRAGNGAEWIREEGTTKEAPYVLDLTEDDEQPTAWSYAVLMTREITQSALIRVTARTPEEAEAMAHKALKEGASVEWAIDDNPTIDGPYMTGIEAE